MRIFIVGAGQVGTAIVDALHTEHDLTVLDLDASRLAHLGYRREIRTVEANGASRKALVEAGVRETDLFIACTSRDEANLVAAAFARTEAPAATTVIRTSNVEYLDLWREGRLDVHFVVSSEIETAHAIARVIGMPAAVETDVFANGQVQLVEFDVAQDASNDIVARPLREARCPRDSRVVAVIRDGVMTIPRGGDVIQAGDRVVVIGSPDAALQWGRLLAPSEAKVEDVVIYGGGRVGAAIARRLLDQKVSVRIVEPDRERAREIAEQLPDARVYHASGLDPDFIERERLHHTHAAIFAMREDAKNHYAATLARVHGVGFTIAIVHDAVSRDVYAHSGVDVTVNPRQVTAEEIVRFAHDPRTQQVAMLEDDRFEVLDITTNPSSTYVGLRFSEMPIRGAIIGALIRDGRAIFPHSDDTLMSGDRVVVFTSSERVSDVESVL
jgi:trk system potassium uptake protein TrkA